MIPGITMGNFTASALFRSPSPVTFILPVDGASARRPSPRGQRFSSNPAFTRSQVSGVIPCLRSSAF